MTGSTAYTLDRPDGSGFATPAEVRWAAPEDAAHMMAGVESRTVCCQRLVPDACMAGGCQHGGNVDRFGPIEGGPCALYRPWDRPLQLRHQHCPGPRSRAKASREADDLWANLSPMATLPMDSRELYRDLVRGDRTFPLNPPRWEDDMMPENWGELDQLLEDLLTEAGEKRQPGVVAYAGNDTPSLDAAAEALRSYINETSPETDGEVEPPETQ